MRPSLFGFPVTEATGTRPKPGFGHVHRRHDGRWQMTAMFNNPFSAATPTLTYSLTPGTSLAQFPTPTDVYTAPESGSIYNATAQPGVTWSGKAPDDQVWSYNYNPAADNTEFFPRLLKVTGL